MGGDNGILPITANPMHDIVTVAEESDTTPEEVAPAEARSPVDAPAPGEATYSTPAIEASAPPAPQDDATDPTITPLDVGIGDDAEAIVGRPQTNSLGAVVLVTQFPARLRLRVHKGHQLIAKRLGVALMICTSAHLVTLTSIRVVLMIHSDAAERDEGEELYIEMTSIISVAALVLHGALALECDKPLRIAAHFSLLAMEAAIEGVFAALQGDIAWATYNLIGWCAILYPLGGWGLHQFLCVAQQLDAGTKESFLRNTLVAFMVSTMPILYLFINGILCISFEGGSHCAVRTKINCSAMLALVGNAVMFLMVALQPVTLKQVTHLDIPPTQLVAFGFHGAVLLLALALHSQNENFGPVSRAVGLIYRAAAPLFLFFLVSFAVTTVTHIRRNILRSVGNVEGPAAAPATVAAVVPARKLTYGRMIPHRVVMAVFTGLCLIITVCPGERMTRAPVGPLSFGAAVVHFWVTAEEGESVSRPAALHILAHTSSVVMMGVRDLYDGDQGEALGILAYVLVCPAVYKAMARFRASVWSHGRDSAVKLVAVSFVAFWSGVVPAMLYLGTDSLGTPPVRACLCTMFSFFVRCTHAHLVCIAIRVHASVCRRGGKATTILL